MKKSLAAPIAILAAGLLVACNGNNGISAPPGTGTNCGGPPNQLEVLYPIPNSKKAPPNLGNVYVATKGALPSNNQYNFQLVQSNGASTGTGPFYSISLSQIPSPHAKPSYSGALYYASALPTSYFIGPAQAVTVFWNIYGSGCTPHTIVESFHTKG